MKKRIGAHVSIAGGYRQALLRATSIGANTLQIFSASPRGWNKASISQEEAASFKGAALNQNILPVYFHASYLINLADKDRVGNLSKLTLVSELATASLMGVRGSVVHIGSFKGMRSPQSFDVLIQNIRSILQDTPHDTLLILENAGNAKIGQNIEELAEIVKTLKHPRIKVCLDTCHLNSAGYRITDQKNLDEFLQKFDTLVGLESLELLHLNDSRDPFGSSRDRHENIGEGTLGKITFENILNHPRLQHLPFIIETPGFDGKGPDKKNIDILKGLVHE